MIRCTALKKAYGARFALDIPELSLADGGRYALIGPNGSGKTTLLRILAGVLAPDGGDVRTGLRKSEIGYLPQSPYAFDVSVLKNVQLALRGRDTQRLAERALERVGMQNLAGESGRRLSGGETQRMALARMIAVPRRLLLLDEPTSATDIRAGGIVEQALLSYAEETGCTMIFSSHAPSQALRLATHVAMLQDGKLAEFGEAGQVLHAPKAPETQAFLAHWRI